MVVHWCWIFLPLLQPPTATTLKVTKGDGTAASIGTVTYAGNKVTVPITTLNGADQLKLSYSNVTIPAKGTYNFDISTASSSPAFGVPFKVGDLVLTVADRDIIDMGDAPVESVVLKLDAKSVYVNSAANVTVKLIDSQNRMIRGETVNLTVDSGTLGPLTGNGDGSFTTKYTAAETIGTATITAVANNGKFASQSLYIVDTRVNISATKYQLTTLPQHSNCAKILQLKWHKTKHVLIIKK